MTGTVADAVGGLPGGPARPGPAAPVRPGSMLTGATLLAIFDAQAESRQLDLTARWMQQQGRGFYTIGSAGHEANAAVAAALRPTDPALLHYRSGGFYCARAHQVPGIDPVRDVLLGVAASADEPIAGGRHKVFGRAELAVIPQTSTIASHLPRALGVALGIGRAAKLGVPCPWPRDAVAVSLVRRRLGQPLHRGRRDQRRLPHRPTRASRSRCCSSARTTGSGSACPPRRAGWPPRTAAGPASATWPPTAATRSRPTTRPSTAARQVRSRRRPAFLHLSMVRFLGHAGSDAESAYRAPAAVAADLDRDPLVATASALVERRAAHPGRGGGRATARPASGSATWPSRRCPAGRWPARPR